MWPVSEAFRQAVSSSNQSIRTRLEILDQGTVLNTDGLRLLSGSMSCDETASKGRRRANIVVVDESGTLIPNDSSDVLSPYGYDFRIWWGIQLANGIWEDVPVGTFRIASAKVSDHGGRTIALDGLDYAWVISRARFESPYQVPLGTNLVTAIQNLITTGAPGVKFSAVATGRATTSVLLFDQASDRMAAADKIADSFGAEVVFDPMGVCVIRTRPNPVGDPVAFTYDDESAGFIFSLENAMTADPGWNGVVVDGEAPGVAPVHAVSYDDTPGSPTNYQGRYGRVPEFYKSPMITTQADAQEAAVALRRARQGGTEILSWTCPGNGAHDAGDIVRVRRQADGVDDVYVLASFQLTFGPAAMSATSRKRRTV
jgi:hypothetical protein